MTTCRWMTVSLRSSHSSTSSGLKTPSRRVEDPEDVDYGLPAARLASQYGGGIWHWLAETPLPIFNYAMGALGPLQAEESLGQVTIGALGNGLVEKDRSGEIMADWERIARGLRKPEKREPDTMAEISAKFQLAGMAVEVF